MAGAIPTYPDGCVQELVGDWWIENDDKSDLGRGRLLRTFVPYVDMEPYRLIPDGRADSTSHKKALYKVEPWRAGAAKQTHKNLPVAALPQYKGEIHLTRRAKLRPVLVVGEGAPEVDRKSVAPGSPKSQTNPTLLVAPYYGADQDGTRAGWPRGFVARMQSCEYPQYMVERLPLPGPTESVLRFDHSLSIGRHYNWYVWTDYRLTEGALEVVDQWFDWFRYGTLTDESTLGAARKILMELVDS